ncbi:MAG: Uma2 family endonuclease [Saprospiraceae bacterium]|nr:Uma2 family endonuclease [Saprospiraceae bacterium]
MKKTNCVQLCKKRANMYSDSNASVKSLAVLEPRKEPRRYTLTEYLRREERAEELHEYYDGIIKKLPIAKGPHNIIVANMTAALLNAFALKGKDYIVIGSQQLVYFPKLNVGVYPDVLTITDTPQYFDNSEVLLINPLIIIEVLSKSTNKYDTTEKFEKYKTLDSFEEYILIDPNRPYIKTHFKEEKNLWRDSFFTETEGHLHLKSVDCTLDFAKIYKNITFKK